MPRKARITLETVHETVLLVLSRLDRIESNAAQYAASTDSRLGAVDARLGTADSKFNAIDTRFEAVDSRFNTVDSRFNTVDSRFNTVDSQLATMQATLDRMALHAARIPEIEQRLAALEERVARVDARLDNLHGLYEHLVKQVEVLEHEYLSITAALKRLEDRFDQRDAEKLADRVGILEQKVAALEKSARN